METHSSIDAAAQDDSNIVAWRERYQRCLQLLADYQLQRTAFERQRQAYQQRRQAYQMMREDLQRVKREQEQQRRLTRRPF